MLYYNNIVVNIVIIKKFNFRNSVNNRHTK